MSKIEFIESKNVSGWAPNDRQHGIFTYSYNSSRGAIDKLRAYEMKWKNVEEDEIKNVLAVLALWSAGRWDFEKYCWTIAGILELKEEDERPKAKERFSVRGKDYPCFQGKMAREREIECSEALLDDVLMFLYENELQHPRHDPCGVWVARMSNLL